MDSPPSFSSEDNPNIRRTTTTTTSSSGQKSKNKKTTPLSSSSPSSSSKEKNPFPSSSSSSTTHQERLEEASRVCARGRELWTQGSRPQGTTTTTGGSNGKPNNNNPSSSPTNPSTTPNRNRNAQQALAEFEHALRLLEPLLGTYHSLTAKTYYWIGFIQKHDPATYQPALQAFVQTARIRLVLHGPSHEATHEALSAIRWVLQELQLDSIHSKNLLQQLYESIRLETLGDAQLRHKNYIGALDFYEQASSPPVGSTSTTTMITPPSPFPSLSSSSSPMSTTAAMLLACTPSLWGKRAFCHSKLPPPSSDDPNNSSEEYTPQDPTIHKQRALLEYRHALQLFVCATVHGKNHFDIPQTTERIRSLLLEHPIPESLSQSPHKFHPTKTTTTSTAVAAAASSSQSLSSATTPSKKMDKIMIQEYLYTTMFESVVHEYEGKEALNNGLFSTALNHYRSAWTLESSFLGTTHLVCLQLQKMIDAISRVLEVTPQLTNLLTALQQNNKQLQSQVNSLRETVTTTREGADDGSDGECSELQPSIVLQLQKDYQNKCQEHDELSKQLQLLQLEKIEWNTQRDKDHVVRLDLQSQLVELQQNEERMKRRATEPTVSEPTISADADDDDAHPLTQELIASKELSRDLQARLSTAELALTEVTQLRQATQTKLDAALAEHNEMQSNIQQQDFSIRTLNEQLKLLQQQQQQQQQTEERQERRQQQQDSTSSIAENTSLMTPSKATSSIAQHYPGTPVSMLSDLRPSETQRNLAMQLQELQAAQSYEKLKSQNSRAVTTIQALSKELTHLESKYRKLFSKYEKTKMLFRQLDSKNTALKERVRSLEDSGGRQARGIPVTPNTPITVHKHQGGNVPTSAILRSVRLSQYRYESSLAKFIVRRPYGMDDSGYFDGASTSFYDQQAQVTDSQSIQLVAVVRSDQSRLYLTSSAGSFVHRRGDGSCVELTVEPLGWVMPDNDLMYSLDALVEEAQVFREHYCQSVLLNARPTLWIHRLMKALDRHSSSAELWSYRYCSDTYLQHGPFDKSSLLLGGTVVMVLVLILAMLLG